MSELQYDLISYEYLNNMRHNFRRIEPDAFRQYDEPGFFFWKPIFYFFNGDDENYGLGSSGLLHPSWSEYEEFFSIKDTSNGEDTKSLKDVKGVEGDVRLTNSAYNYLLRNDEQKRATLLQNFIILLSDISSKTPWYFKEISGLEEALARSTFYKAPKIEDERKKITITCLADSIDTRIGNMLDMYRAACFSWQTKREIVPANLRKFDMGIYVYLQPSQRNIHGNAKKVSHKYIEFHNCEIDIDSCKIGDAFSNEAAQSIEYKIVINYDNCFDNRYSNSVLGLIGDAITTDFVTRDTLDTDVDNFDLTTKKRDDYTGDYKYGVMYTPKLSNNDLYTLPKVNENEIPNRDTNIYDADRKSNPDQDEPSSNKVVNIYGIERKSNPKGGILTNTLNNAKGIVVGSAIQAVRNGVGRFLLGNLYHGSLLNGLNSLQQGNLITGAIDIAKAVTSEDTYKGAVKNALGSFKSATVDKIKTNKSKSSTTKLGNLNQSKSIINNI